MQFFFRNCTHILTRTQRKKSEDMFLVKIASKGTSLNHPRNFPIVNDAFENAAFISLFPSQMRCLLEGGVYKRAAFIRGNTVTIKFLTTISSLSQPGFNLPNCAREILNYLMQCSSLVYLIY